MSGRRLWVAWLPRQDLPLLVGEPQNKNAVGKLSEVPVKWFLFIKPTYRSFATTLSQLKIIDFSGETFKGFEVLLFSMSATTTQLLSSG